jgi:hypothetical protein
MRLLRICCPRLVVVALLVVVPACTSSAMQASPTGNASNIASTAFVGSWRQHGASLTLGPESGQIVGSVNPCNQEVAISSSCTATTQLSLSLSVDRSTLTATVIADTVETDLKGAVLASRSDFSPYVYNAGDRLYIRVEQSGVLVQRTAAVREYPETIYWCGPQLTYAIYAAHCGA